MPPFIHDISVDFPSRVEELSKSSDCFNVALLKEELCYDYRSKPPKSLLDDSVELMKQHSVNDLIEAADERHGPLMFELVLRCATPALTLSNGLLTIGLRIQSPCVLRWDTTHREQ